MSKPSISVAVATTTTESSARTTSVVFSKPLKNFSLPTPNFMYSLRNGSIPYITSDLLQHLRTPNSTKLFFADWNHYEAINLPLKTFLNLKKENFLIFSGLSSQVSSNAHGVNITTPAGVKRISIDQFQAISAQHSADIVCVMSDSVTSNAKSRARKSVERTLQWTAQCAESANSVIFSAIEGGESTDSRIHHCKALNDMVGVRGIVHSGLNSLENRTELIKTSHTHLNPETLRVVLNSAYLIDIFDMIDAGIDLMDSTYPTKLSEQNLVLAVDFETCTGNVYSITDAVFVGDKTAMMEGCECYACTEYAKGYVNHLVEAKEILGTVLLQLYGEFRELS